MVCEHLPLTQDFCANVKTGALPLTFGSQKRKCTGMRCAAVLAVAVAAVAHLAHPNPTDRSDQTPDDDRFQMTHDIESQLHIAACSVPQTAL